MLPTGLTYSSLAKRSIRFIANCTCGVGRKVFRSSSKRVARGDAGVLTRCLPLLVARSYSVIVMGVSPVPGEGGLHPQNSVTLSYASDEGRAEQPVCRATVQKATHQRSSLRQRKTSASSRLV